MLPDLLFSAGGNMEDLCLLRNGSGGCDQELNPANFATATKITDSSMTTLDRLKLPRTPDLEPSIIIKLEDSSDIVYPWNVSELGSNLLNTSCDPLLPSYSSAHNFKSSPPPGTSEMWPVTAPAKRSPIQKITAPRMRKKGQFKLRFHHQALPQEYLEHYNNTLQNEKQSLTTLSTIDTPESPQDRTNENIRNWLQKISELQNEGVLLNEECNNLTSVSKSPAPQLSSSVCANPTEFWLDKAVPEDTSNPGPTTNQKVVNYRDLPFMGEMTLDNSKPRRGRKPKKADICHLIYKNYGTILPGTPAELVDATASPSTSKVAESSKRGDVHNKISSLLEKRLTVNGGDPELSALKVDIPKSEEPLNLCVRDSLDVDSLTVSSGEHDEDDELTKNLKVNSSQLGPMATPSADVFWAEPHLCMQPMALYYQKLLDGTAAANQYNFGNLANLEKIDPHQHKQRKSESFVKMPSRPETESSISSQGSNRTCTGPSNNLSVQKRKRSAIFIPPLPLEASNPTEVSICKFKFTGGATPSLQEKKILSVDSGGNFRYYSGTGDKSMRGYEFFPRERLQQSALVAGSSTGAFLNAHGEKMPMDLDPQLIVQVAPLTQVTPQDLVSEQSRDPNQSLKQMFGMSPVVTMQPGVTNPSVHDRKRSRRSIQRENMERTFKEKGFLIQTSKQQTTAGATYCKFRQLKKFTRYLFRSWKNYLPGDLQQHQPQLHDQLSKMKQSSDQSKK